MATAEVDSGELSREKRGGGTVLTKRLATQLPQIDVTTALAGARSNVLTDARQAYTFSPLAGFQIEIQVLSWSVRWSLRD